MLRALLERDLVPDLVLGTSVGALNGAMVASQPDLGVVERLTELWAATAEPIVPPAPERFSITNDWPICSETFGKTMRATMSFRLSTC